MQVGSAVSPWRRGSPRQVCVDMLSLVSGACSLLVRHLRLYLHASHNPGATLEFQLCSMCLHVRAHALLLFACTARHWLLPAACVCVDPLETPAIYAIWQTACGRGSWATPLNSRVSVCADKLGGHMVKPSQVDSKACPFAHH